MAYDEWTPFDPYAGVDLSAGGMYQTQFNPYSGGDRGEFSPEQYEVLSPQRQFEVAQSLGFTGPNNLANHYLLGIVNEQGQKNDYGAFYRQNAKNLGTNSALSPQTQAALIQQLQQSDPQSAQLFNQYQGESTSSDFGDTLSGIAPALWSAGLGGMIGASGAFGGAGDLITAGEGGGILGGSGADMLGADAVNLGSGATGLTEGATLASESGFLPGSFDLGTGLGSTAAAGLGAADVLSATTPAAAKSLIPGIPNNVLTGVGQGILGTLGSNAQQGAFDKVSDQNLALGAPYRGLLQKSYGQDFNLMNQPGYGDAFNRMADISTRQWSPRGNPANNPGIQGGILNDVWNQSYLPALSNYRGQLGQFGGLGLNTAGAAQMGGASTAGGAYDALGVGLDTALNPKPDWNAILSGSGGNNPFTLNVGGKRWGG